MQLRAQNKSLASRVHMLEKELEAAKSQIADLKRALSAAKGAPSPDSADSEGTAAEDNFTTARATPPRSAHGHHARHTSMPDPLGIDNDVVEKPIDVSVGRSSSLSRASSLAQISDNMGDSGKTGRGCVAE